MNTSTTGKPRSPRAFVPNSALAKRLEFTEDMMNVYLTDGRILGVPLAWSPRLLHATTDQRGRYEIGGGGRSLHWPDIDEDLSIAGLMAGADWQSA